jgi:erythronate-4-phosphate dehydrogenase
MAGHQTIIPQEVKIVCDSHIPFLEGVLEPYAQVQYAPGQEINREMIMDADALIIRTRTRCDSNLLEGTKVRFIATATIGFDHIDTQWCKANGITWTNAPGCNSWSVQQYMGSLLVTMANRFGFECKQKTLGVVGVGNVGFKVARLAALLGFRILLCDPPRARREGNAGFVSIDEIIEKSDIITCHVPLTESGEDATYHLFDSSRLKKMNSNQILINTSRGEVVDGDALKQALKSGSIKAASLDVWEHEPAIDPELLDLLFTATPHIAGYSIDGKATGTMMCVHSLAKFFDLPCADWEIDSAPLPRQPLEFQIDAEGKSIQQVLSEAILHSYDIMEDDARLRADIDQFEKLRSSYPVRREFPVFSVRLMNDTSGRATVFLREAGFNITE